MQQAVVRSLPNESNMTISLVVAGKQRNMDRPKDELLEKPLGRLQKSAAPQQDKQARRQAGKKPNAAAADSAGGAGPAAAEASPFVGLHAGPSETHPVLDAGVVTNEEAWRHGRLLRVGGTQYQVVLNPPFLARMEVHAAAFVGIPLMLVVQLHFAEEEACRWAWYRQQPGSAAWEPIPGVTSRRYTPAPEDVGCHLRVECTPARPSSEPGEEAVLGEGGFADCGPVGVPPAPAAVAPRHALTRQQTAAPELRVVTYNILADQYAATETAKNVIFAHCPPQFLKPEYRWPLVLNELLGFNADLICLQEVDEKAFTAYLAPQLAAEGFRGVYTNKAGKPGLSVREGQATFFRTSRFTLAGHRSLKLKELFPAEPGEQAKYGQRFEPMLSSSPQLQHALQRIATVAQISLLAPVQPGDRLLCVLNTHLFFHYMAPHIRTMHVWAMVQEAHAFIEEAMGDAELAARLGGQRPSLLFCGDLNSDLNDGIPGAIELLSKGTLHSDFWDWWYGAEFKWDRGEEGESGAADGAAAAGGAAAAVAGDADVSGAADALPSSDEFGEVAKQVHSAVEHAAPPGSPAAHSSPGAGNRQQFVAGVELDIPFRLRSADGLRTPFTNYVQGYQGLLDYIWYEPSALEVVREVPLPTLAEMGGTEGYLPSQRFPSDHLPVVFDLRFRAEGAGDAAASSAAGGAAARGGGAAGSAGADGGGGSAAADGGSAGAGNVLPAALYNVGAAAEALARSEVLAVPTDTLYGLAACANSSSAVAHIYATKQRGDHKPLAICVADVGEVGRYGDTQHLPKGLLEDLLPGPVTLLLARLPGAPLAPELNPGVDAIGIRIPDAPFIRAVCRQHRSALALTSANKSGGLSSIAVNEFQELWPACSLVFDGGALDAGRSGSTVIDLATPGQFVISRRGAGFARTMQLLQEKYGLRHVL
ncbi:2, 5 -phosphodiesterase 12 [Micractinium conductrix]|uniref:Threonylcarbamoyl-AMP synthase n=1 Tax=Micractinium conductrix TaxID=554055 RepID=A0A2P6VNC5_9CHLO|nr:2, 5 -phosphodiesterase 12 [Micractinium conductrix]|eukprot:PSC75583.1 2, 5 -phosphodiesterase 12 [Micractinium conductrix]